MRRLFYTLLVILALATAASANTAIYNDETSFLSALQSGYYLEDFNNFTYGTYYYNPLGFGPTNGFSYGMSSPLRGLFSLDGKMANLDSTETIIIDFSGSPFPVKAVGGNFWPTDIEGQDLVGNIDLSLSDGTQLHLTNADFTTFRGFVSDGAEFTHMRISTGGGETEISYPTVDHLYIGQPTPPPTCTYTLSVSTNPPSGGTVTKNPQKSTYCAGDQVTLTAYPNSGYMFYYWSGAAGGSSNPTTITMNGNWTATANFAINRLYVSHDGLCGGKSLCFTSMQNAIDSAQSFAIIEITQETYYEDLIFDDPKVATLQGGWDATFSSCLFYTTIKGSIRITNGTMILENIIVK